MIERKVTNQRHSQAGIEADALRLKWIVKHHHMECEQSRDIQISEIFFQEHVLTCSVG